LRPKTPPQQRHSAQTEKAGDEEPNRASFRNIDCGERRRIFKIGGRLINRLIEEINI